MVYGEAMSYICSLEKFGSVLGLDSIRELMKRLGNPQDAVRTVHVAGTNGKGSIITYLEYVLRSAGYRTGKYISPSVVSYWERIQVNGKFIQEDEVAELAERVKQSCEDMVRDGWKHPTVFEFETAMAFLYFLEKKCDVAIIETGMGGDTDATNIIKKPVCEVIASVSMDHMGILGNSLEEIAQCKAGIIKEDTDVVIYGNDPVVEAVMRKKAQQQQARLVKYDEDAIQNVRKEGFSYCFDYKNHKEVRICLAGEHQIRNAAVALEAVEVLKKHGFEITPEAVREGMQSARWPGRFECICKDPVIVVDGAHNRDAAEKLRLSIENYFPDKKKIFVMGIFRDKEYERIIELTNPLASEIITINSDNPRSIPAEELKEIVKEWKITKGLLKEREPAVFSAANPTEGIIQAVKDSYVFGCENTAIIAFGSLSFLGEIRQCVAAMSHTEV
jgi:dihydrofolate synthase/folylpolyglutamate synthase